LEKYLIEKKESNTIPVILFDEIEKGHNNIQNLFLEMFDEGTITFRN
jgi:ATP-dependent Clp protease ATP-binding subunit ClpA